MDPNFKTQRDSERDPVAQIADAVLYEGYILYPYRLSALKNRQRWNFGGLCPRAYAEAHAGSELWRCQTQCLAVAGRDAAIHIKLRFLRLIDRQVARFEPAAGEPSERSGSDFHFVESLHVAGRTVQAGQEAAPCELDLPEISLADCRNPLEFDFHLPPSAARESLNDADGAIAGAIIRRQNALDLAARVAIDHLENSLFKLTLEIVNHTSCAHAPDLSRDQAMMYSPASTHAILHIVDGEFISSLDPPEKFAGAAAACANTGLYPVLAGREGQRRTVLASPVILYDYPKIAPQSAVNLFDGTEIDEILTLRILALTDREKAEMRHGDERARRILEQIESNPAHLAELHGAMHSADDTPVQKT